MDLTEKWKEAVIRDKVKRQLVADALAADPGPAEQALALGIPCTYCHAPAGRSCVGPRGLRLGGYHNQRQLEALGHEWRTPEQKALARWPVHARRAPSPKGKSAFPSTGCGSAGAMAAAGWRAMLSAPRCRMEPASSQLGSNRNKRQRQQRPARGFNNFRNWLFQSHTPRMSGCGLSSWPW